MKNSNENFESVAEQIAKEMLPVFAKHELKAGEVSLMTAEICNRIAYFPDAEMGSIRAYLSRLPLAVYLKHKAAIRTVCQQAAEDLRLLIESDGDASHEASR